MIRCSGHRQVRHWKVQGWATDVWVQKDTLQKHAIMNSGNGNQTNNGLYFPGLNFLNPSDLMMIVTEDASFSSSDCQENTIIFVADNYVTCIYYHFRLLQKETLNSTKTSNQVK